jgi:membrane-associated phospholipid phosphatase
MFVVGVSSLFEAHPRLSGVPFWENRMTMNLMSRTASSPRGTRIARAWGSARSRVIVLVIALVAFTLCAVGGALIGALVDGRPTELDSLLFRTVDGYRAPWLDVPSLFLNQFGGGDVALYVVPGIAAVIMLFARGILAALLVLPLRPITQWSVNALKAIFERPRPHHMEVPVTLSAYPSGHSAVAACLVVVLAMLIRRRWFWIVSALYVIVMGFSRMYLNVHWFTDILGGTALGIAIGLAVWAIVGAVRSLVWRHPLTR